MAPTAPIDLDMYLDDGQSYYRLFLKVGNNKLYESIPTILGVGWYN